MRHLAYALVLLVAAFATMAHAEPVTIRGVVTGPEEKPVEKAQVWLCQDRRAETTETDAEGRFSFAVEAVTPVALVALKDGLAIGGATVQAIGSGDVAIVLGTPAALELRVVSSGYQVLNGARLKSLIVDERFAVPVVDLIAAGFPSLRSDEKGIIVLPWLPENGTVDVLVSHYKHTETQLPGIPVSDKTFTIQIYPGPAIKGRVTNETGNAVRDARVIVYLRGDFGREVVREELTDPEGYYVAVVPPGNYGVLARHPDYAPSEPKSLEVVQDVEETVADLVLPEEHVVHGQILDAEDKPIAGVPVAYRRGTHIVDDTLTLIDGRFELSISKGDGQLDVMPPPGYVADKEYLLRTEEALVQTLDPIRLKPLPAIEGIVVDEAGAPVADALVSTIGYEPPILTTPLEDGTLRIVLPHAPDGDVAAFRVEHGHRFLRGEFTVNLAEPEEVRVVLKPFEPDMSENKTGALVNNLSDLVGIEAPPLECAWWLNSDPLTLEELRGKVVVLTLWAGFDREGTVRNRIEEMRALDYIFKDADDVVLIGVHAPGSAQDEIKAAVEAYGIEFPVASDEKEAATFKRYNTRLLPQTVLIDKEGRIRYFDVDNRLLELVKALRR